MLADRKRRFYSVEFTKNVSRLFFILVGLLTIVACVYAPPHVVQDQGVVKSKLPSTEIYFYAIKGQREEQQATDRYQCHRWGVEQTSFDPTQPGGNVPEAGYAGKRDGYYRAMKACLEGRKYSVK